MTDHTIPLRKPLDQLKLLELEANASASRNHTVLELQPYWLAKANHEPVPSFRSLNLKGAPVSRVRLLSLDDQAAIQASLDPVDVLSKRYSVDAWIVRDIKCL